MSGALCVGATVTFGLGHVITEVLAASKLAGSTTMLSRSGYLTIWELMTNLPASLLAALDRPGSLDVVLVVGAGCSTESPTNLELASEYSRQAHEALVRRGVIGEIAKPWDLSELADEVVRATGSQKLLVAELPMQKMKQAKANEGYRIAAALQIDGFVRSVLSLNYDAAGTAAISELSSGYETNSEIHVVESVHDLPIHGSRSYIFLNGSSHSPSADLILTTSALKSAWVGSWTQVVVTQAMNVPVVAFVGLGSPAQVLSETLALIVTAVGDSTSYLLVGPGDQTASEFAVDIRIAPTNCVDATWTDFMESCAAAACDAQLRLLEGQFAAIEEQAGVVRVDVSPVTQLIRDLGLLGFGNVRKQWATASSGYHPHPLAGLELMQLADVIHFLGEIHETWGREVELNRSGYVQLRAADGTSVQMQLFAPNVVIDFEAAVAKWHSMRSSAIVSQPELVVIARTNAPIDVVGPVDIIANRASENEAGIDIVRPSNEPEVHYMRDVRLNPDLVQGVLS